MWRLKYTVLLILCLLGSVAHAQEQALLKVADMKLSFKTLFNAAGLLKDVPYTLEFFDFASAADSNQALNARAVDIAGGTDAPLVFALAAGAPLKAVAVSHIVWDSTSKGFGTAILTNSHSPLRSVAELKGKRIATVKGSSGQYLTVKALEAAGLHSSDVEFVYLSPADSRTVLLNGQVDAWSTWMPYTGISRFYDKSNMLVDGRNVQPLSVYVVANDQAVAGKQAMIQDFVQRYAKAAEWANNHPDEYAAVQAKTTGIAVDVYKLMNAGSRILVGAVENQDVADLQDIADTYLREGVITKPVNANDGVFQDYLGAQAGTPHE